MVSRGPTKQASRFHCYHYVDHGTNYHTAMIAPNRSEDAKNKFILGWLNWAGPPNELSFDSASEFVSEQFKDFTQSMNIKASTAPPQAHWQLEKCERHGMILQEMLQKYEVGHPINTYPELQEALSQCTSAKNACSIRLRLFTRSVSLWQGITTTRISSGGRRRCCSSNGYEWFRIGNCL